MWKNLIRNTHHFERNKEIVHEPSVNVANLALKMPNTIKTDNQHSENIPKYIMAGVKSLLTRMKQETANNRSAINLKFKIFANAVREENGREYIGYNLAQHWGSITVYPEDSIDMIMSDIYDQYASITNPGGDAILIQTDSSHYLLEVINVFKMELLVSVTNLAAGTGYQQSDDMDYINKNVFYMINPRNIDNDCFFHAILLNDTIPIQRNNQVIYKFSADQCTPYAVNKTNVSIAYYKEIKDMKSKLGIKRASIDINKKNIDEVCEKLQKNIKVYKFEDLQLKKIYQHTIPKSFNPNWPVLNMFNHENHWMICRDIFPILEPIKANRKGNVLCPYCDCKFTKDTNKYTTHLEECIKPQSELTEYAYDYTLDKFKNHNAKSPIRMIVYYDFETDISSDSHHIPISYCIHTWFAPEVLKAFPEYKDLRMKLRIDEQNDPDQLISQFVEDIDYLSAIYSSLNRYKIIRPWESLPAKTNDCCICGRLCNDDEEFVIHHDHFTGKNIGYAHNTCNINEGKQLWILKCVAHNHSYDLGLILQRLDKIKAQSPTYKKFRSDVFERWTRPEVLGEFGKYKQISIKGGAYTVEGEDEFVSTFTKGSYYNKKDHRSCIPKTKITFIDSFGFMNTSLDKIAKMINKDVLLNYASEYFDYKLDPNMVGKSIFPYSKFTSDYLQTQKEFLYEDYKPHGVSEDDFNTVTTYAKQNNWKFKDLHDYYIKFDVLILACFFDKVFTPLIVREFGVHPLCCMNLSSLSRCLGSLERIEYVSKDYTLQAYDGSHYTKSYNGSPIYSIPNEEVYDTLESTNCGGLSTIFARHSSINQDDPQQFIWSLDVNNLYSSPSLLPDYRLACAYVGSYPFEQDQEAIQFQKLEAESQLIKYLDSKDSLPQEIFHSDPQGDTPIESLTFYNCDMTIDPAWHDYWCDSIYPAWIKNIAITPSDLLPKQLEEIKKQNGGKFATSTKLIGTYSDQKDLWIEAGRMKLLTARGCHFVNYKKCMVFTADNPLLPLISKCTELRIKDKKIVDLAKTEEGKDIPAEVVSLAEAGITLWKNLCNILYGSSLLNLKRYGDMEVIINDRKKLQKRLNNPRTFDFDIVSGGAEVQAFGATMMLKDELADTSNQFIAMTKSHSKTKRITSPYQIGYSILHHSKSIIQRLALTIQDFCIKEKVILTLLFTDTDSINMEVLLEESRFKNKHDFVCAFHKEHPDVLDVSSLPGYDCYSNVCNKIPGLLGDEYGKGPQPIEFVGIRAKTYQFLFSDGSSDGGMKGVSARDKKEDGTGIGFSDFKSRLDDSPLGKAPVVVRHTGIKMDGVYRRNLDIKKKAFGSIFADDKVRYDDLYTAEWHMV